MQTIKADIRSERNNVQSQDIVMFFSVANFFTAYQRCRLIKRKVRLKFLHPHTIQSKKECGK